MLEIKRTSKKKLGGETGIKETVSATWQEKHSKLHLVRL